MTSIFSKCAFATLLSLVLAPAASLAASPPLDEPGFTKAVAKLFRADMPGSKVKVRGPLALEIRQPDGTVQTAYLDTVYSFCQRNPDECETAVKLHVGKIASTFVAMNKPGDKAAPDRSLLRAVLRPVGYVDQIRKVYAGKGTEEPPVAPFVGDLWIVCAIDMPDAIKYVAPGELAKMGLSREQALDIAKRNDTRMFTPIEKAAAALPGDGIGIVASDAYDSSRLLAFESWAPIADRMGGQLLVAAPAADAVIFLDARRPNALEIMRRTAAMIAMKQQRPLSQQIFRWSPAGWIVAG